jgi:hypothetical protein
MPELHFSLGWEDPGAVRGPELAATWARLQIRLNGIDLTESYDEYGATLREALYLPVYPIAEWFAANWWHLWFESRFQGNRLLAQAHRLRAAEEGFALPDLNFWSEGNFLALHAHAYTHFAAKLRFLNEAAAVIPVEDCRQEAARLIEQVVARLDEKGISGTFLQSEWDNITRIESVADRSEARFCQSAAQMGLDPFDVSDEDANQIENAISALPYSIHADLFEISQLSTLSRSTGELSRFFSGSVELSTIGESSSSLHPWEDGYRLAQVLRRRHNLAGRTFQSHFELFTAIPKLSERIEWEFVSVDHVDAALCTRRNGSTRIHCGLRRGRAESELFRACRALAEIEFGGEVGPVLLTASHSRYSQKRSRAFAAEFLAPASEIERRIHNSTVLPEEIDEIAVHFGVSPFVIRDQIRNHKLAEVQE